MTHVLILVLGYPLVVSASVWTYAEKTEADIGRINQGFTAMYLFSIALLTLMYYV